VPTAQSRERRKKNKGGERKKKIHGQKGHFLCLSLLKSLKMDILIDAVSASKFDKK
jgi:hypothetical protein